MYLSLVIESNQRHIVNFDVGISPVFILSLLFKQINAVGDQKCFVQDMEAKFPSSKQHRVRIRKLGSNNIVTVQLDMKVSYRSTSYLQII